MKLAEFRKHLEERGWFTFGTSNSLGHNWGATKNISGSDDTVIISVRTNAQTMFTTVSLGNPITGKLEFLTKPVSKDHRLTDFLFKAIKRYNRARDSRDKSKYRKGGIRPTAITYLERSSKGSLDLKGIATSGMGLSLTLNTDLSVVLGGLVDETNIERECYIHLEGVSSIFLFRDLGIVVPVYSGGTANMFITMAKKEELERDGSSVDEFAEVINDSVEIITTCESMKVRKFNAFGSDRKDD